MMFAGKLTYPDMFQTKLNVINNAVCMFRELQVPSKGSKRDSEGVDVGMEEDKNGRI